MGVDLSDLSSGTNCFMAQRLVRRLCPHCKREIKSPTAELEQIKSVMDKISPTTNIKMPNVEKIYEAVGCPKCHGLGYHGRIPVAEVMEIDEEMEKYIITSPTTTEIQEKAIEKGMLTMGQDGILRVEECITTIEEVARVSDEIDLMED
jgi:type II secretory ATPase GspE/PulE/Tfp pilus assembly ATPase PilB-like protein